VKYKCRPADPAYHADGYYTKEVAVDYTHMPPDQMARRAAELFAEMECHRRSEYEEMDVQVLLPVGWVTFEVNIVSVPEFTATRRKEVPPEPPTFVCDDCHQRRPLAEETYDGSGYCRTCEARPSPLEVED
jgi:hypothetical protein